MQNLVYKSNRKREAGQGLVEYILVVALMGVLAIAAIHKMSDQTQRGFDRATDSLKREFDKI